MVALISFLTKAYLFSGLSRGLAESAPTGSPKIEDQFEPGPWRWGGSLEPWFPHFGGIQEALKLRSIRRVPHARRLHNAERRCGCRPHPNDCGFGRPH